MTKFWLVTIGGEAYASFSNEEAAKEYAEGEWGEDWEQYVSVEKESIYHTYNEWKEEN